MRATINGTDFLGANELYAQHVNGILAIAARASDGRTIHITVLNKIRPDTVDIGFGSVNSAMTGFGEASWRSNIAGGKGTVRITKADYFGAEGTFTFTGAAVPQTGAKGARTVSGRFTVAYEFPHDVRFGRDVSMLAPGHAPVARISWR